MFAQVTKVEDDYITLEVGDKKYRCKKNKHFMAIEDNMPINHLDLMLKKVRAEIKSRKYCYTKDGIRKEGTAYTISEAVVRNKKNKYNIT
jgi:uncharacterized protein YifE (UPF0438 family)